MKKNGFHSIYHQDQMKVLLRIEHNHILELLLLTHKECWGFVAKKINRRNGQTAWRIVNHKDNFNDVSEDEILLTLNLDEYNFKNWANRAFVAILANGAIGLVGAIGPWQLLGPLGLMACWVLMRLGLVDYWV